MATTEQITQPEAPAEKETKTATRKYVVLELEGPATRGQRGEIEAPTDKIAISVVCGTDTKGTFVAVPKRSFNPRSRTLETPSPKAVWS